MHKRSVDDTKPHASGPRGKTDAAAGGSATPGYSEAISVRGEDIAEATRVSHEWTRLATGTATGIATPPVTKRRPIEVVDEAKKQLHLLTGYPVDSVAGFGKTDEGWRLTVTVLELSRIPDGSDVLADYEVGVDEAGDIVSYHKTRRFFRSQIGEAK